MHTPQSGGLRNRRNRTAPFFYALGLVAAILAVTALITGAIGGFLLALGFTVFFAAIGLYFMRTPAPTAYEKRPVNPVRRAETSRGRVREGLIPPIPQESSPPESPDDRPAP